MNEWKLGAYFLLTILVPIFVQHDSYIETSRIVFLLSQCLVLLFVFLCLCVFISVCLFFFKYH